MPQPVEKYASLNVLGLPLTECSQDPVTGFFRNGCCDTADIDRGSHTVCVLVTEDFLSYSKSVGNDLSTPRQEFGFAGLKPGDQWCLCAARFRQAFEAGHAPRARLLATHKRALELVPMDYLREMAVERN